MVNGGKTKRGQGEKKNGQNARELSLAGDGGCRGRAGTDRSGEKRRGHAPALEAASGSGGAGGGRGGDDGAGAGRGELAPLKVVDERGLGKVFFVSSVF